MECDWPTQDTLSSNSVFVWKYQQTQYKLILKDFYFYILNCQGKWNYQQGKNWLDFVTWEIPN